MAKHRTSTSKRQTTDVRYPGKLARVDSEIENLSKTFHFLRRRAIVIADLEQLARKTKDLENDSIRTFITSLPFYREDAITHYTHIAKRLTILIRERIFLIVKEEELRGRLSLPNPTRGFADSQLLQDQIIGPLVLKDVFCSVHGHRLRSKTAVLFYLLLVGEAQTEKQIEQALMIGRPLDIKALKSNPDHLRTILATCGYFQQRGDLWYPKPLKNLPAGFQRWLTEGPISRSALRINERANLLSIRICNRRQQERADEIPAQCLHKRGRPTKQLNLELIGWLATRGTDVATMAYLLDSSRNWINYHALAIVQERRHKPNFKIIGNIKKHVCPQLLEQLTRHGLPLKTVAGYLKTSKNKLDRLARQDNEIRRAIYVGRQYARCRRQNIEPPEEVHVPPRLPTTNYVPNFKIISQHKGQPGRVPTPINTALLETLLAHGLTMSEVVKKLRTTRGTIYRQSLLNPAIRMAIQRGREKGGTLTKSGGRRVRYEKKAA